MDESLERIIDLERANYEAMLPIADVTPDMDLILRDDVILTSNQTFPAPDTTHACLLRATPQTLDSLLSEIVDYFKSKDLPTTLFVSPACTPADLSKHLVSQGFVKQKEEEAWLVLEDLANFPIPKALPSVEVKPIGPEETATYADVFVSSFGMPSEFAPYMAQRLQPVVSLPGFYHYLAFIAGQPIGACFLIHYKDFGILGSAGVKSEHRRSGAANNLAVAAANDARSQGVNKLMLQTTAGTWLERLIRISGFKKVFTRASYTLP